MTERTTPTSSSTAPPPTAWRVGLAVAIVHRAPDGRDYGDGGEVELFQIHDETDASLVERAGRLLGVLRARAIAIDAWRRDASRLSLRAPWPIPAHFSAEGAWHRTEVNLGVILETKDARVAEDEEAPSVCIRHRETAPLATPRVERIRRYVELTHAAIRHEVDECLFVDDRRAHDPHEPPESQGGTTTGTTGTTGMTGTTSASSSAQVARPRRVARLTITIERLDREVLAEDSITQTDDESDSRFVARAAIVLEFLRLRSGTPSVPEPAGRIREAEQAGWPWWPWLPSVKLEREHLDRLEALVRSWTDPSDAVLAGLLSVYGLHGDAGAVRPETIPREMLHRYVSQRDLAVADADRAAVSALISALEERDRRETPPGKG